MLLNVWFHNSCQRNSLGSSKGEQAELRKGTSVLYLNFIFHGHSGDIPLKKRLRNLTSVPDIICDVWNQTKATQNRILNIFFESNTAGQLVNCSNSRQISGFGRWVFLQTFSSLSWLPIYTRSVTDTKLIFKLLTSLLKVSISWTHPGRIEFPWRLGSLLNESS